MLKRIALIALLLSLFPSSIRTQTGDTISDVNLLRSKLPANVETKLYKGYVAPRFNGSTLKSFYLPMRDGVKIAITVVLPEGLSANEKIPAVMTMTRYWRGKQGDQPATFLTTDGYAAVFVDARGTGASYGLWAAPFSRDEIKDYNEVVNWIATQPWS